MGDRPTYDFSGYATKADIECADKRIITPEAFKHMDGMTVPLVWQHGHNSPDNVLGHALLEARSDGVYAYGFFNETTQGQNAKQLVAHKDVRALSIWANGLVEKVIRGTKSVLHGTIREVSLVLSGANPKALIDYVSIQHSDGEIEQCADEAVIYTGLEIVHGVLNDEVTELQHESLKEIYDSMSEEQKNLVHFMLATAIGSDNTDVKQSDESDDKDLKQSDESVDKEGTDNNMTHNVFEKANSTDTTDRHYISHEDKLGIFQDAMRMGSMKEAVEAYALKHGIDSIDTLFPDAKAVTTTPEFDKRRTEWVAGVLNGTRHTPFSRIKSLSADITHADARAKGYVKGNLKKEEFFAVAKRVTTPQTIYKKQALDRDDMIDITDFDVVAWLKGEMRLMLEEELARAILISDGRDVEDEDKIQEDKIRPIATDHELYVTQVYVNIDDANSDYYEVIEAILRARRYYKGTGMPKFYTTEVILTEMLLTKDSFGRRRFRSVDELAIELRVSEVVPVEPMEDEADLIGIVVNLADYTIGADRGGEVNFFDDFDIDYNKYKYLYETRVSGALTKIKAALVIKKTAGTNVLVTPNAPTFVASTGVVTIPTQTGVVYKDASDDSTLTAGAQTALDAGATLNVQAVPATGYYFATNREDQWSFTRPLA